MIKNTGKIRRGSALLVAILVMAILMTITLGLSSLVISQIRQTGDAVAAGKAYYAAEAGTENALLDLHENLPGYQTMNLPNADSSGWVSFTDPDGYLDYRYRIRNQGNAYPYLDSDEPIFLEPGVGRTAKYIYETRPEATYNALPLHQTVTIPLFVACADGINYRNVNKFLLQYYVKFKLRAELGSTLSNFDILRWKLFGQPSGVMDVGKTDAISDFYPVDDKATAAFPVCIGSDFGLTGTYECTALAVGSYGDLPESIADWNAVSTDVKDIINQAWGAARECYTTDSGDVGIQSPDDGIQKDCSMSTFMEKHTKNYLTITNVVNPEIIDITNPELQVTAANIYYRVIAKMDSSPDNACPDESPDPSSEDVMVREAADISADGYVNNKTVTQSINAKLKLNSFLPVFNFSLFRTDPNKIDPDLVPEAKLPI
jgi:type II secretory pathway pseudopilin PulG